MSSSNPKLKSLAALGRIAQNKRKAGKKIVFTNGCFDILHAGHIRYLKQAKSLGDVLVIAINTDASVKKLKGPKRPICSQAERAEVLSALESVDYVTFFGEPTPIKVIRAVKPDLLVKGGDWKKTSIVGWDFVESYGGKVKSLQFVKGKSTTNLIEKLLKSQ
jgi:D-beta-D-heptose 7-phosphate kinase/D-beta-D-heptose 1-phosphate adenosyltransferase